MGFGKCQRAHRKPVERFKQGRECNGSLKASERRRERYRLFFVVLVAVFSGGKFYHKNRLTSTVYFVYKEHKSQSRNATH
ncbi:hypothetical protein BXQ27_27225 [Klebsiella aerogenes]|nr:hypothetical protein BXQ27_27225 [Klebsiella aerogenes]